MIEFIYDIPVQGKCHISLALVLFRQDLAQGWANHGPRPGIFGPQDYSKAVGKYLEEIHLVNFIIIILVNQ